MIPHFCPDELLAALALVPGLGLVIARLKLWWHVKRGCRHLPPVTPPAARYVIGETPSATWNYHLRLVEDGKLYPNGGYLRALCGVRLGWDTKIPPSTWGLKDHIPTTWCTTCKEKAR